jgi:hypothetical protein
MKIPAENRWTQLNDGDILGALAETHNCCLCETGKIKLNKKSIAHATDVADFEQIHDIAQFGGQTYLITDGKVFDGDLDGDSFTVTTSSPNLDTRTSAVVFNSLLYVNDGSTVDNFDGSSTWTSNVITGLSTANGVPHPMTIFESLASHQLAIGDANSVKVYDSASPSAGNGTNLSIPANYIVTTLAYRNGYLYVGTKDEDGNEALVFVWNGSGAAAQYSVPMGASWVWSLVPYGNTVAGLTNEGELFMLNGNQKVTLAGLPLYYNSGQRWYAGTSSTATTVSLNGLTVIGDRIFMNIEGQIDNNGYVEGMQDGVWCYDPRVGLYHYTNATVDLIVADNGLTRAGNVLTTQAAHGLKTGDPIQFRTLGNLTGLSTNDVYYAEVLSTTTLSVCASRYDADNSNVITLGGTPNGSDKLLYVPNTDYGTVLDGKMGAIMSTTHRTGVEPLYATEFIYGAEPNSLADAKVTTVQGFVDAWNVGWFATQKIYAQGVQEFWDDVSVFINGNLTANEEIVVKYRTEDRQSIPTQNVNGTWTNATLWTTTNLQINDGSVKVGDEVMVTTGAGQGRLAHITAISESSGTVSVTVDESIGVAAASADFVVTGYKKLSAVGPTRPDNGSTTYHIGKQSSWIQIKVEMRGYGIEVPMLELTSKPKKI